MTARGEHLSPAERARLVMWQRRLRLAAAGSIVLIVLWWGVILALPDEPWTATLAVVFATPLVVTGVAMQRTGRCPRCGARVGLQSRLALPASCLSCGVSFR